jgi:hypothetical protein
MKKVLLITLAVLVAVALAIFFFWLAEQRAQGPAAIKQYTVLADSLTIIDRGIDRAASDSVAVAKELADLKVTKQSKKTTARLTVLGAKADSLEDVLAKLGVIRAKVASGLKAIKESPAYKIGSNK